MPAVYLTAPRTLEIRTTPPIEPAPGQAVVRLLRGGLCGTDLHGYAGDNPLLTLPRIPGHELVGEVVDGGGAIEPGTLVAIDPMITCGECRACRVGRRNACVNMQVLGVHVDGGFRSEMGVPVRQLHRLPAGIPMEWGALVEPLSIGANACLRADVAEGDRVLVQGAGPIGLCCLLLAKARGASVLVADALPSRLALAERMGADATFDVRGDAAAAIAEATGGDGPDIVIEAAGNMKALAQALELAAPAGVVVTLAITRERLSLAVTETMVKKELDFRGSRLNRDLFPDVIALLARGAVDPSPLVTHRFKLTDADAAYRTAMEQPAEVVKVLLDLEENA